MSLGEAVVEVGADTSGFEADVTKGVTRAGKKAGGSFGGVFGKSMKTGAAVLGVGAVSTATVGLVKNAVNLEASFGRTMNLVAASTGAPASAIGGLSKLAMKLGADTQFSANEAASAMLELGKAGIGTSDIMGGALSGTLLLASAGSTDLGTAATIASNAMNTFNLHGRDMASIAAALAGGANASSASVESLGQALQQVGPGATNAGLSLQQTVGVLSAFDAAGIKGSDAGTSLKTMLSRLIPTTQAAAGAMADAHLNFVNANGSFKSITEIAGQLQRGLGGLSEAQKSSALATIFGSDASRAATVLMNQGAKGLAKYIQATKDQGAAQKMAKANMSGTAGAMERLSGSVETAELALGQVLAPTIRKTADWLSNDAVPAITGFITGMQDGTGAGGDFADVLGDVVSVGKGILAFFDSIPGPVKKYGAEILIASVAIGKMNTMLGGFSTGVKGFITNLGAAETRSARLTTSMQSLGAGLRNVAGAGGMMLLTDGVGKASHRMGMLESAAGGALSGAALGAFAGPQGAAIGAAIGGLAGAGLNLAGQLKSVASKTVGARNKLLPYISTLDQATAAITQQTKATALDNLMKSHAIEEGNKLGLSSRVIVNAALGMPGAMRKVQTAMLGVNREFGKNGEITADANGNFTKAQQRAIDLVGSVGTLSRALGQNGAAFRAQRDQMIDSIITTGDYKKILPGIPKEVVTKINTLGIAKSRDDIVDLTRKYHLTPEQVRTVLSTRGYAPTAAQIKAVTDQANNFGRLHPKPKIDANTQPARNALSSLVSTMNNLLSGNFTALVHVQTTGGGGGKGSNAGGTRNWGGGWTRVGEHGPELVNLPSGSRIWPATQTRRITAGALPLPGSAAGSTHSVSNSSSVQLVVNNPVPETVTQSLPRALANLSFAIGGA